ncbi:MAG: hypothetical protein D4R44_01345 [Actinobacteria bacterium]|nr:MAG: hypothetical protein D4R44_01345 [Actinomycetota bacterium]
MSSLMCASLISLVFRVAWCSLDDASWSKSVRVFDIGARFVCIISSIAIPNPLLASRSAVGRNAA